MSLHSKPFNLKKNSKLIFLQNIPTSFFLSFHSKREKKNSFNIAILPLQKVLKKNHRTAAIKVPSLIKIKRHFITNYKFSASFIFETNKISGRRFVSTHKWKFFTCCRPMYVTGKCRLHGATSIYTAFCYKYSPSRIRRTSYAHGYCVAYYSVSGRASFCGLFFDDFKCPPPFSRSSLSRCYTTRCLICAVRLGQP